MAADPEPGAPPLGPERSRESLPDESLDLDARAVESPRTEPQDPAGDVSHARGVDDALCSARHQVVTSATPSHGSSVIDAVVDAAVDASMETEEARLEDVFLGKDDEADDEADARASRVVSSVPVPVPAPKPPPRERRAPPPPAPRGRGTSGKAGRFRDADVSLVSLDSSGDATVPRDGIENRPELHDGGVEKTNASAAKTKTKTPSDAIINPLTSSTLFASVGASRPEDVTSVNLTGCAYDSIEPGAFFAAAPFLERLVAAENGFTSADLAELGATLTSARRLNIACNRVDDTFTIRPSVRNTLGAYARDVGSFGSFFPALTVLDARGNAMGAAALAELGKLPSLERLDVSGNAIRSLPSHTCAFQKGEGLEGVDSKTKTLFFPKLTHLDVSAQTPKMRFTVPELAAALGSCPRLRVVVARKNAGFSEPSSDASCVLTPGIDFPALRALDLRDNALRDPASVAPLCALATRAERRRRRGVSDVGVAGGGRDDADDDEENQHDAFFETRVGAYSRIRAKDPQTMDPLFDSTTSSFGSANNSFAGASADESDASLRVGGGRLEEVALGGNACADVLLTRLLARVAESAGPASSVSKLSSKLSSNLSSLRLTPREHLERALASKSVLFRGVEPPARFGGATALAAPARVVHSLAARASGEETFFSKTNAKDEFETSTDRGAVFTLVDGGADGALPRTSRERLDMRRMATASAASPARASTKLAFDFEKRVPETERIRDDAFPPDDPFVSTTDAASAYASRLDARLATDRRKALSRKYAESAGIAGETRARARAAARARSAQTLGWVVDDEYTGK